MTKERTETEVIEAKFTVSSVADERVHTGIDGLDPLIEGGLPKGSLVLLAGNPGTGKTIFSMQFLYRGVKDYGENGIYVSFAESEEAIFHNMSKVFGFDIGDVKDKLKVLDFTTVTEKGLSTVLEMILEEVAASNAKRLVIDSFSAMAQAFKEPIEARSILHNILGKLVRQLGCTTLLIIEVPTGSERLGISIEEFVADGVIFLKKDYHNDMLIREIEIKKMRGTRVERQKFLCTMHKGFKVFKPFNLKEIEKLENLPKFEATRGTKTHYPSGIPELDEILGGNGYPRGASVLFELGENVPLDALFAVLAPTAANFIMRNRGLMVVPPLAYGPDDVKKIVASFTGEEQFEKCAMVTAFPNPLVDASKPYVILWKDPVVEKLDPVENFNLYIEYSMALASRLGKNVMHILNADNITYMVWGGGPLVASAIGRSTIANNAGKDLMVYVAMPSFPEVTKILSDTLHMHFKIEEKNGAIILYGKKPKTTIYVVEPDPSRGCRVRLTPML
ncbi:MAG: ATPase domain-containing protein [Candidatus Bathyarchaeia archaeon]